MAKENIDRDLQLSMITLLAYSKKYGAEIAGVVAIEDFDTTIFRPLAKEIINYRNEYGNPPGEKNLKLLVQSLALSPEDKDNTKRVIAQMSALNETLNRKFAAKQAAEFSVRSKYVRDVLSLAKETQKSNWSIDTVSQLVSGLINYRPERQDLGIKLSSIKSLGWLDHKIEGFKTGIKPFDEIGLRFEPGTVMQYLGRKNSGKSWACVHFGREVLKRGGKVLHITLEMSEQKVAKRYHQSFNRMARKYNKYKTVRFFKDSDRVDQFEIMFKEPKITEGDMYLRDKLLATMDQWRDEFRRLRIKQFPTGSLTMNELRSYLDRLASGNGFEPDLLIIDYADLMKVNKDRLRHDLTQLYVDIRGEGVQRGYAAFLPSQINRTGYVAEWVDGTHAAEAIGKIDTADSVIAYSQTLSEREFNVARLELLFARDIEVGTRVAISQAYSIGRYCVQAIKMSPMLERKMLKLGKDDKKEEKKEGLV